MSVPLLHRQGKGGQPVVVAILLGYSPAMLSVGIAPNWVRCHQKWQW